MMRWALLPLLFLIVVPAFGQDGEEPLNVYYGEIPEGDRTFFVAPGGDNGNSGTETEPWASLDYAVTQVARGDVIVMRGGVYYHDDTIRIQSPSGFTDELIVVTAYPGEVPILDFSGQPKERNYHGIRLNANWWHLIGLTIRYASHNGIRMDGSYNILEQLTAYGNHDTGIHMAGGASNNVIRNCDSFHNFNFDPARTPRVGNNADGFSAKFEIGPGNVFYGCRSWENSDDGFDFWEAQNTITVENSWAFGNGDASVFDNPENFEGNGNGFKLGGNFVEAGHIVMRSMAFDNFGASGNAKGFDYNNNFGAMTLVHNTAYNNGRNYFFPFDPSLGGQPVFLNNLSAVTNLHAVTPSSAVLAGNSWQFDTEITEDMFLSVDTELATSLRATDGSLPNIDLLVPQPESFPIDRGVVIAEPFYGAAPDQGVYEYRVGDLMQPWVDRGSGAVVSDLRVFDVEGASFWMIREELAIGTKPFEDSDLSLSSISGDLVVDEWIQTPYEARTRNYLFTAVELQLNQARQVLVAHSDEIVDKPEWLASYTETAAKLVLSEPEGDERFMTVYQRAADAGEVVTLGRNSADGTPDVPMYLVLIGSTGAVAVEDRVDPSVGFVLNEIYPNPVGVSVNLSFRLARGADVSIRVYDAMGRAVSEVVSGYHRAGSHLAAWSAGNLASGIYYVRMVADGHSAVRKFVRVR